MKEHVTVVTRKGQITIPAAVRRALGIKEGDKVAVSVPDPTTGQVAVRTIHSVTELTFGAIVARNRPEDIGKLRRAFIDGMADNAMKEGEQAGKPR